MNRRLEEMREREVEDIRHRQMQQQQQQMMIQPMETILASDAALTREHLERARQMIVSPGQWQSMEGILYGFTTDGFVASKQEDPEPAEEVQPVERRERRVKAA